MKILLDPSALVKRYLAEPGRDAVQAALSQAHQVAVAAHCKTELVSALTALRSQRHCARETRDHNPQPHRHALSLRRHFDRPGAVFGAAAFPPPSDAYAASMNWSVVHGPLVAP